MYSINIQVGGIFNSGFVFELCRTRWLWIAKLRAELYLMKYPYREVYIKDLNKDLNNF
jgi:hypothetical protein